MNWTNTPPTKPGDWKWRDRDAALLLTVELDEDGMLWAEGVDFYSRVSEMGGEWLPLFGGDVLEAKLENAYLKGWNDGNTNHKRGGNDNPLESLHKSNLLGDRIATGEQEPSL